MRPFVFTGVSLSALALLAMSEHALAQVPDCSGIWSGTQGPYSLSGTLTQTAGGEVIFRGVMPRRVQPPGHSPEGSGVNLKGALTENGRRMILTRGGGGEANQTWNGVVSDACRTIRGNVEPGGSSFILFRAR